VEEGGTGALSLSLFGGIGVFNSGLCACKAGTPLLEPHVQSILLYFGDGVFQILPRLALNKDLPNLK
jgi:hypothetical protein